MSHPEQNVWGERLNAHLSVVPKFAHGEPVLARCGGPCMIVASERPDGWIDVQWFGGGQVFHESFPAAGLRRANWLDRLNARFGG